MVFHLSYFKSWKMMLWKCCTQYVSKFKKLTRGHRTGQGQFSFQFLRKAMPKNAQTSTQLHSSHTLVKECSKFSKPGFSNTWTENFQMFKLVLERHRNQRRNFQYPQDHRKSKTVPEKHLFLLYWLSQSLSHNKLWKILKEMGIPDHLICLLNASCPFCRSGSKSENWPWHNRLVPNQERNTSRLYIVTMLI